MRDGRLWIEGCEVEALAHRFGTPLYVMSEDGLRRRFRRFQRAFGDRWPEGPVHVLPSLKANYTLALRRILSEEGAGADTFGPGELHTALAGGVRPELISVNGSSKDDDLLERALRAGARVTLDSVRELERTRAIARRLGLRARVRFRLRPRYEALTQPSDFVEAETPVREVAQRYKPGIPTDDLRGPGREALHAPELDVSGVMVHLGRHSTDLEVWRGMVRSFVELVADLSAGWDGWQPREVDLGGGFATPRDPTGRLGARGSARPPGQLAPPIEEYAEALTGTLREEWRRRGLDARGVALEVEPGRSLYADAGIHLTTVRGLKAQREPLDWRWVETDTTEMFLLDSLVEHNRWTPVVAGRADAPPTQRADLVGISCGFDVVVPEAELPDVAAGDVIALLDTGAYQDATATNFNALPRPATVLVHGAEAEVVKRAETVEDVFRRDQVPARLAGGLPPTAGPR